MSWKATREYIFPTIIEGEKDKQPEKTCSNCKYLGPHDICHRYPSYVRVNTDYWCGEWSNES